MKQLLFLVLASLSLTCCYYQPNTPRGSFAKGADVGWLSEMEHDGVVFKYGNASSDSAQEGDCLGIMQEMGMNSIRLRVWVNHATGWSNKEDVVQMAQRAAKQGLRVMIDFHYSDFFADPSHQTIPAAWQNYDNERLCEAVGEHTRDVLFALKEAGVKPEWMQIGNETPKGMLWPAGRVTDRGENENLAQMAEEEDNWEAYAAFTTAGYKAAKEVFPDITTIVHVDNAYMYRDWFFREMEAHGGQFDMIGLSHYPMMSEWSHIPWQEANRRAAKNIRKLISTFHKPVMIAEIGMLNDEWLDGKHMPYDTVAALSKEVMTDFLTRIADIDSCAGVFYWEPQCYGGWRPAEYIPLGWGSYPMGSFTPEGNPSPALQTLFLFSREENIHHDNTEQ